MSRTGKKIKIFFNQSALYLRIDRVNAAELPRGAPRASAATTPSGSGTQSVGDRFGALPVTQHSVQFADKPPNAMRNSGFIASRLYDSLFFIFSPILAFAIVLLLSEWTWIGQRQLILGVEQNPITFFIVVWTHAHLFAVFFRSHANTKIFARHRFAFVAVPILLFAGFMASDWLIITGLLVSGLWAVYHLGMQNFGLGRIYDARCGNPPEMGRTLDYWLHQLINLGPFIAGLCLIPSLAPVRLYRELGWNAPAEWLRTYGPIHSAFSGYLLAAGLLFLAYYSYAYGRFTRQGYRLCPQKIALLVSTGSVSVVAWGFLPAWKAFFVMNFFHSLQY
ncbi:MAG: hypothetical protein JRH19_14265, partial [Deltaproteobacteria bacterium]|nr:hypothetical protein [Deltaproteobacteria bacterium]